MLFRLSLVLESKVGWPKRIIAESMVGSLSIAARDLTTQEVEQALRKENVEFPAGRIESKDIDLTIKLDKAYQNLESYKKLPLKRAKMAL